MAQMHNNYVSDANAAPKTGEWIVQSDVIDGNQCLHVVAKDEYGNVYREQLCVHSPSQKPKDDKYITYDGEHDVNEVMKAVEQTLEHLNRQALQRNPKVLFVQPGSGMNTADGYEAIKSYNEPCPECDSTEASPNFEQLRVLQKLEGLETSKELEELEELEDSENSEDSEKSEESEESEDSEDPGGSKNLKYQNPRKYHEVSGKGDESYKHPEKQSEQFHDLNFSVYKSGATAASSQVQKPEKSPHFATIEYFKKNSDENQETDQVSALENELKIKDQELQDLKQKFKEFQNNHSMNKQMPLIRRRHSSAEQYGRKMLPPPPMYSE